MLKNKLLLEVNNLGSYQKVLEPKRILVVKIDPHLCD